ncbi:MAG: tetratricopeptide repeat protein [Pirellulales bacterium]
MLLTIGSIGAAVVINAAKQKESAVLAQETIAKNEAIQAKAKETKAKNDALTAECFEKICADETAAVVKFIETRIFAAARPEGQEGGLGKDVTLAAAIEAALPFVSDNFAEQPVLQARLKNMMGLTDMYLGKAAAAAALYEDAIEKQSRVLGPDHRNTLAMRGNLALAYAELGKYDEALVISEKVLAGLRRVRKRQ